MTFRVMENLDSTGNFNLNSFVIILQECWKTRDNYSFTSKTNGRMNFCWVICNCFQCSFNSISSVFFDISIVTIFLCVIRLSEMFNQIDWECYNLCSFKWIFCRLQFHNILFMKNYNWLPFSTQSLLHMLLFLKKIGWNNLIIKKLYYYFNFIKIQFF